MSDFAVVAGGAHENPGATQVARSALPGPWHGHLEGYQGYSCSIRSEFRNYLTTLNIRNTGARKPMGPS